jgi:hypothetical protein
LCQAVEEKILKYIMSHKTLKVICDKYAISYCMRSYITKNSNHMRAYITFSSVSLTSLWRVKTLLISWERSRKLEVSSPILTTILSL